MKQKTGIMTVQLPITLHQALRRRADDENTTLKDLVIEALSRFVGVKTTEEGKNNV